jgi:hypothetical protein
MDEEFFREQGAGSAREQHCQVTARHLNHWLSINSNLVSEALAHRDELHGAILRDIGLNVRKINSEPHVAMTRGLWSNQMKGEMALSSFGDVEDTGFGGYQHHVWMPLKDLWYGFPAAPRGTQGNHGHENEWLFSNSASRYQARDIDVTPSIFQSAFPGEIAIHNADLSRDDDIARGIAEGRLTKEHAITLSGLGKLGPLSLQAALAQGLDKNSVIADRLIPREVALQTYHSLLGPSNTKWADALSNPNLNEEDLGNAMASFPHLEGYHPQFLTKAVSTVAAHPSATEKVLSQLVDYSLQAGHAGTLLPSIAKSAKIPSMALHRALIEGLDTHATWMPSKTIARCFGLSDLQIGSAKKAATQIPTAFNNSQNSERYLRALASYFKDDTDEPMAKSAYHSLLCGGRINDTTMGALLDIHQGEQNLPGVTPAQHRELLGEMARFNPHLSNRQLIRLSNFAEGAEGLVNRSGTMPVAIQQAIAENADFAESGAGAGNTRWPHVVINLATRSELAPSVADTLLKRLSTSTDRYTPSLAAFSIAANPLVPTEIVLKHVQSRDPQEQTPFEKRLIEGLKQRGSYEHMILPVPVGGME